jgi:hypothetical protein
VGAGGEVVDDVRRRVGDRGARRGGVEQVDLEAARAREVEDILARVRARAREVTPREAGRAGDQDAPAAQAALRPARR